MIEISIIIPAYNVQEYIATCLESIALQTFKNYEVIIINDGSKDDTQLICEQFTEKIQNINIISKSNEGQAVARNIGTQKALGRYVCYIDSDDWIAPTFLETLYLTANKYNFPTVVQCGYFYSYDTYLLTHKNKKDSLYMVLTKEEALKELIKQKVIKNFPWGKIIKAEVAKLNLMPNIPNYEDVYWFYNIIDSCDKYIVINTPLYYYRQRKESMTYSINDSCIYLLDGYKSLYYFIRDRYTYLEKEMLEVYLNLVFNIYTQTYHAPNEFRKKIVDYVNDFKAQFNNNFTNKNTITKLKFLSLNYSKTIVYTLHLIERILNRFKPNNFIKIDK